MTRDLEPYGDNVLVEPIVEKTFGSLHLSAPEPPTSGRVVAIGTGCRCPKCNGKFSPIEKGDLVIFPRQFEQRQIRHEGIIYLLIPTTDVLAKLTT